MILFLAQLGAVKSRTSSSPEPSCEGARQFRPRRLYGGLLAVHSAEEALKWMSVRRDKYDTYSSGSAWFFRP